MEAVHDLPEEISLWQSLLLPMRFRQIVLQIWQGLQSIVIASFDAKLRPHGYYLGRNILLVKHLLLTLKYGLYVIKPTMLLAWHQVPQPLGHIEPEVLSGSKS